LDYSRGEREPSKHRRTVCAFFPSFLQKKDKQLPLLCSVCEPARLRITRERTKRLPYRRRSEEEERTFLSLPLVLREKLLGLEDDQSVKGTQSSFAATSHIRR